MPTNADLLLDTGAAVALVSSGNAHHDVVHARVGSERLGLSGHAEHETYSVLTRMPPPLRLSGTEAARLLEQRFPATHHLTEATARDLVRRWADAGVVGGAVYDALVATAALEADLLLLSCDQRARATYGAVGVRHELVR